MSRSTVAGLNGKFTFRFFLEIVWIPTTMAYTTPIMWHIDNGLSRPSRGLDMEWAPSSRFVQVRCTLCAQCWNHQLHFSERTLAVQWHTPVPVFVWTCVFISLIVFWNTFSPMWSQFPPNCYFSFCFVGDVCISKPELSQQNTTDWVAYTTQGFFSYVGWLERSRSNCWPVWFPVRGLPWLTDVLTWRFSAHAEKAQAVWCLL